MRTIAPRLNSLFGAAVLALLIATAVTLPATAGPWLAPGNSSIRADVQLLADTGVLRAAVTTWPLAWGDIAASLQTPAEGLNAGQLAAIRRLQSHFDVASVTGELRLNGLVSLAKSPRQIRTFEDGPREDTELGIGVEWTGNWLAVSAQGQWVNDPSDGKKWRADGSYAGIALGNWMLAAAITDRWWGPGWQGSLILGNNARPIPAITLERNSTQAFETKWLSWIGPWDVAIMYGRLESDREIPNTEMFGMRVNFKPLRNLEIGISRTSLLCGTGLPCGLGTRVDMLAFSGTDGAFDHLAGFDVRWSTSLFSVPLALYTQLIGEDGDFFPSDYLGQFGAETWAHIDALGSIRVFFEWSDTECDFRFRRSVRNDTGPGSGGCAYTNGLYKTGQSYRGRSFAHSFSGDSSVFTLGGMLTDSRDNGWLASVAIGNLNRRNGRVKLVAENKTRYREVEVSHRRENVFGGNLLTGLGYDYRRNTVTGVTNDDIRVFFEWTFAY